MTGIAQIRHRFLQELDIVTLVRHVAVQAHAQFHNLVLHLPACKFFLVVAPPAELWRGSQQEFFPCGLVRLVAAQAIALRRVHHGFLPEFALVMAGETEVGHGELQ
jgi:hypothetical protein